MNAVPVAFVSSHAKLGGAERYLELLIGGLAEGWVAGVVLLEDGPFADRLRGDSRSVVVVPTGRRPTDLVRSVRPVHRVLRTLGARVVHANGIKAALVAGAAARTARLPTIWVKHDFTGDGALARVAAAFADQIVGVSSAVVETFGARTRRRKVTVVPNAVVPAVLRGDERAALRALIGAPDRAPVVSLVGRIAPDKGQNELLAAAPAIVDRVPAVRFAFIGAETDSERTYAESLRRSAEAAGLMDRVAFLGFRDDAARLLAGADVVVVPSVRDARGRGREGFGLVGLEAFAAGSPVVGYADGALEETLGGCALLVAPGDRAALADAIIRVLSDAAEARRLVDCGRQRVAGRFSLDALVTAMQDHYLAVAKPNARG